VFNKRWKKILLWTLSVIVVLGIGGLFAANYAVDKLMNSMAGGFELEPEDSSDGGQGEGTVPAATAVNDNSEPTETPVSAESPTPSPTEGGKSNQTAGQNQGETAIDPIASAASQSPSSPATDKAGTSTDGYTAQISTGKAKQIQENVTIKEKADVASIVLGQLSTSDIKRLQDLANGGLTIDEKREARRIVLDKVSEEQYNELSEIAKKYGVSQGKTRDQVIAEEKGSE
jgi:hypothetical protein